MYDYTWPDRNQVCQIRHVFCQDGSIVLATVPFVIIWLLDVSEKENRSYHDHAESRELNLPLVYVCRVEI